jgi:hypothetical protein
MASVRPLLCALTAVIAPAVVWRCAQAFDPGGFVPMPFGDLRLVIAQAVAVLPLSWLIAGSIPKVVVTLRRDDITGVARRSDKPALGAGDVRTSERADNNGQPRLAWLAVLIGLALVLVGPSWTTRLEPVLNAESVDAWIREFFRIDDRFLFLHFLRVATLLLPAIALCYAAGQSNRKQRIMTWLLCLSLALIPTYLYGRARAAAQRQLAHQYLREGRTWLAWQANAAAVAIDRSTRPQARELFVLDRMLNEHLRGLRQFAATTDPALRLRAVPHLLALDEHEQAKQILAEFPQDSPAVRTFRIELARRDERWNDVI